MDEGGSTHGAAEGGPGLEHGLEASRAGSSAGGWTPPAEAYVAAVARAPDPAKGGHGATAHAAEGVASNVVSAEALEEARARGRRRAFERARARAEARASELRGTRDAARAPA